jgi:protein-L-isoaspartate(D-aspartate) O-methyltransferase
VSAAARTALVAQLRKTGAIRSDAVAEAFAAVDRERFLTRAPGADPYADLAIAIKQAPSGLWLSSSSQPTMMAHMLELLELRPGQRVLEIGAGSGYNAALMAYLAGPGVTSIDIDAELAADAAAALGDAATVVVGDGRAGWPAGAPYDRIMVTAATATIPDAWTLQLTPGGRLVAPMIRGDTQAVCAFVREPGALRRVATIRGHFMELR